MQHVLDSARHACFWVVQGRDAIVSRNRAVVTKDMPISKTTCEGRQDRTQNAISQEERLTWRFAIEPKDVGLAYDNYWS